MVPLFQSRICLGNQKNDGRGEYSFNYHKRINMPDVAEQVLADGNADMVSMARPFLAIRLVLKSLKEARRNKYLHCSNQACLDHSLRCKFLPVL